MKKSKVDKVLERLRKKRDALNETIELIELLDRIGVDAALYGTTQLSEEIVRLLGDAVLIASDDSE